MGLAAAERFLKAGMKVVMADIDADSIDKQVSRLKSEGHPVKEK
ncbi:MAG: hypothetical protein EBQ70_00670 [Betaproteobacteria bacterium]|nr:hypothetical protein [Betaproteobacteria bacterium]